MRFSELLRALVRLVSDAASDTKRELKAGEGPCMKQGHVRAADRAGGGLGTGRAGKSRATDRVAAAAALRRLVVIPSGRDPRVFFPVRPHSATVAGPGVAGASLGRAMT